MKIKIVDIVLSFFTGLLTAWIFADFLSLSTQKIILSFIIFFGISISVILIGYSLSKKFLFIFQGIKHVLVGVLATIFDLKLFEFLNFALFDFSLLAKGFSFLGSIIIKYLGNKYWVFEKKEKVFIKKELLQFLMVTFLGMTIDILVFFWLTKIIAPFIPISFISFNLWIKISVILAALVAALWNFLGYKFIVFKK